MARKPARTHVHYVHIVDDLYAIELRQGQRRWTIGRVSGSSARAATWVGLVIGAACWGARVKTRRAAVEGVLAAHGLMLAEATQNTVVPLVRKGDLVEYQGSVSWMRGVRLVVGYRERDGRYELLVPETGRVELRQVRRASFAPVAA